MLDIKYSIKKEENKNLMKDYSALFSRKSNEHIYMAGFEAMYEWTIKKYTPYIAFKAGFGITTTDSYNDIFYNASFALKAGTYITFNKNFILNLYTGADYTTLFNVGLMAENINITIPDEYLQLGTANNLNTSIEYYENYDKNINMLFGAELNIYKYSSIFAEVKYINNIIVYSGIKVNF